MTCRKVPRLSNTERPVILFKEVEFTQEFIKNPTIYTSLDNDCFQSRHGTKPVQLGWILGLLQELPEERHSTRFEIISTWG